MPVRPPKSPLPPFALHASTSAEAEERFQQHEKVDPFPDIPCALLNSADIDDYARQTGLIFPFDPKRLKSASYACRVGQKIVFWEGAEDKPKSVEIPLTVLEGRQSFRIPPNSLVFVQTEEEFRLPNYIAARFNLQISLVHKGLLLGTGPLVDPGFCGKLLVPLHNLTENEYALCQGDEFIWVEFTKVSPNPMWDDDAKSRRSDYQLTGAFAEFNEKKRWLTPDDYIRRALAAENKKLMPHRSIRNSLPKELRSFERRIKGAEHKLRIFQWGAFIAVSVTLLGAFFGLIQPAMDAVSHGERALTEVENLKGWVAAYPNVTRQVIELEQRVRELEAAVSDSKKGRGGKDGSGNKQVIPSTVDDIKDTTKP